MENKATEFYLELTQAIQDEDKERFDKLMDKRADYLERIQEVEEKKEMLLYFIEKDKEMASFVEAKKNGVQQLLLTQNNQLKAMKKYEQF